MKHLYYSSLPHTHIHATQHNTTHHNSPHIYHTTHLNHPPSSLSSLPYSFTPSTTLPASYSTFPSLPPYHSPLIPLTLPFSRSSSVS